MRAFISVELGEKVKAEIRKIQASLPEFSGKKTKLENLHLTLKFLGEVSEEEVEKAKKALRLVKAERFEAELNEIGVFTPNFIKIVWVKLGGCDELQKAIDESLKGLFEKEKRFMSHITIARVKKVEDKKGFFEEVKGIGFDKKKMKVKSFFLMESKINREGPEYNVVEGFELG